MFLGAIGKKVFRVCSASQIMETPNPVQIVKSNLTPTKVLGFIVLALATFAIFDALKISQWIFAPVTSAKQKFGKQQAA